MRYTGKDKFEWWLLSVLVSDQAQEVVDNAPATGVIDINITINGVPIDFSRFAGRIDAAISSAAAERAGIMAVAAVEDTREKLNGVREKLDQVERLLDLARSDIILSFDLMRYAEG